MTDVEKKLIEKSKNGDVESFEKLIEKYQAIAFNIAYRMVGNIEDARDMAQEAIIKVYRSLKKFRGDSNFSTWFYRIVINNCIDMIRINNKFQTFSIDKSIITEEGSYCFEMTDNKNLPDEIVVKKERKEIVQGAIKQLPEKYRIMIVLRDLQDFTYGEISEITECPVRTVKSRISRGRLLLKELLKKEMEFYVEK